MAKFNPIGVNKTDTLAAQLTAGATSATLTSGNFGTQTGLQLLVVDYDVPAKIEVISCTITGTSLTGITRALDGTSDVTHSANANVLYTANIPSMWTQLYPLSASAGWTDYSGTVTYAASGSMTYTTVTTAYYKYFQVGKMVWFQMAASGTTGGTASTDILFSLPVTAASANGAFTAWYGDSGNRPGLGFFNSTTQGGVGKVDGTNWALGAGKLIRVSGCYEAA